jgi:hypothetical protein
MKMDKIEITTHPSFIYATKPKFPVLYNGKLWKKKECCFLFLNYYSSEEALDSNGSVYVTEDSWVYPDGKIEHR